MYIFAKSANVKPVKNVKESDDGKRICEVNMNVARNLNIQKESWQNSLRNDVG
jgi:NAD-dependent SIR2 family protein deacetylase